MKVFIAAVLLIAFTAKPNIVQSKCYLSNGVNSTDIELIVKLHNQLRSKVAKGTVNGYQASNMLQISWDPTLAELAQTWANNCTYGHNKPVDNEYLNVGQNIAITEASYETPKNFSWAINYWFDEVNKPGYPPPGTVIEGDKYPFVDTDGTGHYTQIIWANTSHVGCGFSQYKPNSEAYDLFYVCNYGPAGNYLNLEIYLIGSPASNCPYKTTNSTAYPGLCA